MKALNQYQKEMVLSFSTLMEQRDDNTGGHIRRTSKYVELLAKELRNRGFYNTILTNDYISDLTQVAPMHAKRGGEIILDTFGRLDDKSYVKMAYEVATYHHEKWDIFWDIKEKVIETYHSCE